MSIKINTNKLNFLLEQYNVNVEDLLGVWIYSKEKLLSGNVTQTQLEYLGKYFYINPDFLLEDEEYEEELIVEHMYSEQHLKALASMDNYKRDTKGILLKAEACRNNVLQHITPNPVDFDGLHELVPDKQNENKIGFNKLRDVLWDKGILVLAGISTYRDFFMQNDVRYAILNFDTLPVIIINLPHKHLQYLELADAVLCLVYLILQNKCGIIRTKQESRWIRNNDEFNDKGHVTYTPYKSLFGDKTNIIRLLYSYGLEYCRLAINLYKKDKITLPELLHIWFNGNNDQYIYKLLENKSDLYKEVNYRKD